MGLHLEMGMGSKFGEGVALKTAMGWVSGLGLGIMLGPSGIWRRTVKKQSPVYLLNSY